MLENLGNIDSTILIVDDDENVRNLFIQIFESEGCTTLAAANVAECKHLIDTENVDLAVADYWLPDGTGAEIIQYLRDVRPEAQSIMVSAFDTEQVVDDAIQNGAFAFMSKPIEPNTLLTYARRALNLRLLASENDVLLSTMKKIDEELSMRNRKMNAVTRIASLASEVNKLVEPGEEALSIASEALRADAALLYYVGANSNGKLILQNHRGLTDKEQKELSMLEISKGLVGKAGKEKLVTHADDLCRQPIGYSYLDGEPVLTPDMKRAVATPVSLRGQHLGVIVAGYRNDVPIDESELTVLSAMASQFGVVVENKILSEMVAFDSLTGLHNRGYFDLRIHEEINRAKRHDHPLTLCFADIDHFKKVNDTYGHMFGDRVLREVAHHFKAVIRLPDFAARYGGEEFALVLPETPLDGGILVAERLRRAIESMKMTNPSVVNKNPEPLNFSVSIGVSNFPDDGSSPNDIINRADQALYKAKRKGRNRVVGSLDT